MPAAVGQLHRSQPLQSLLRVKIAAITSPISMGWLLWRVSLSPIYQSSLLILTTDQTTQNSIRSLVYLCDIAYKRRFIQTDHGVTTVQAPDMSDVTGLYVSPLAGSQYRYFFNVQIMKQFIIIGLIGSTLSLSSLILQIINSAILF